MFKRRTPIGWIEWARASLWPRKGWRRGFQYMGLRVQRLKDSPHSIALGFAFGAFVSFTPMFGFHMIGCLALAWIFRASLLAAAIGQLVGNAFTIGPIAVMSVGLGRWMLGRAAEPGEPTGAKAILGAISDFSGAVVNWGASFFDAGRHGGSLGRLKHDGAALLDAVVWPYFLGGLIPGLLCAAVSYWLVYRATDAFQKGRAAKIEARAARSAQLRPDHHGLVGRRALHLDEISRKKERRP